MAAVTVVVSAPATNTVTAKAPTVFIVYYFPASLEKSFGFDIAPGAAWKTAYSEAYGGGAVQTQQIYPARRNTFTGPSMYLSRAERKVLRQFFDALAGRANPCYFFFPDTWEFDNLLVGTTSGSAGQVVTMRLKESTLSDVLVGGASLSGAYTFAAGVGPGGEDRITITNAQTAGLPITVAGYGRVRFKARLTSDEVEESWWDGAALPYAQSAFEFTEEFEIF